eukprot:TRINITY_DN12682_c0_g2_i1.p1 TRINITY_DN12682_c0_g2~~TRINITY_DN12682_c0_g2_i1.p1  ORF type:complete len:337 (+),score=72.77 TRINITY_DN12682_c0_g2_i1:93-1013(+)
MAYNYGGYGGGSVAGAGYSGSFGGRADGRRTPPLPGQRVQLTPAAQRFMNGERDLKVYDAPKRKGPGSNAGSDASSPTNVDNGGGLPMPSFKVHGLASDIARLEDRCNWLEDRNIWLTQRLLSAQRQFINRTLAVGGKALMSKFLEAWREAMHELRLERQLDEQTRSLDQCQNVAKELGGALTQEQAQRAAIEDAHRKMEEDLKAALEQEQELKAQMKQGQRHLELLERRVHEAETCLVRSAAEARAVIDTANEYERHWREIENEHKNPQQANLVEHSIKLRGEAHGVMKKATTLLTKRGVSPERD